MTKDINQWNKEVLTAKGIHSQPRRTQVVKNVGDLQKATTWDGIVVERTEYLYTGEDGLVKCAPYELHFVYEIKDVAKRGWGLYCTCGSIAGVVGLNAYSKLASPTDTGKMVVCIHHTATKNNVGIGEHADGSRE